MVELAREKGCSKANISQEYKKALKKLESISELKELREKKDYTA